MKVLIIGGTGFISGKIAEKAAAALAPCLK